METVVIYSEDFKFLTDVKNFVMNFIEKDQHDIDEISGIPIYDHLSDGRTIRLVFPQGLGSLKSFSNDGIIYFVGFIGYARSEESMEPGLKDKVWEMDASLIKELLNHPNILGYISGERVIDGNWGNLVLFKSQTAISEWRNSSIHWTAVNEISPKYYTEVRIHGGQLSPGLTGEFDTDRTLFLDYSTDTSTKRVLRKWKEVTEQEGNHGTNDN